MLGLAIAGVGLTPVGKMVDRELSQLAAEAARQALMDAGRERADAIYVGNMLSSHIDRQGHLGPLIAEAMGLRGTESVVVDAACASGAAALRCACLGVASGAFDVAVAVGVEKMARLSSREAGSVLASAADAEHEVVHGATFVGLSAMLMRRYQYEYGVRREDFAEFSINSHENALVNPNAMLRKAISLDDFMSSRVVAEPLSVLDASPIADGAAAVVVCSPALARESGRYRVRVLASACSTDSIGLLGRADPLHLTAVAESAGRALRDAGVEPSDMDFLELHDAFSIMSVLALEAGGFAPRGRATWLARDGELRLDGRLPICTHGGLKARGHPVGATGLYQVVEATRQLRGAAGANQVRGARLGLTQSIGGSGSTVITHILEAT